MNNRLKIRSIFYLILSLIFLNSSVSYAYNVEATREGLVGYRTANGHLIVEHDWFVAFPSVEGLDNNFDWSPRVRITRGSRSIIAPVWDVGPWNELDNYWVENRNIGKLGTGTFAIFGIFAFKM
ncbi:hypothetical protein N9A72_00530 [bacterium]|nr:hypothetical protein [bacterium]